jgi:hypothetical protein
MKLVNSLMVITLLFLNSLWAMQSGWGLEIKSLGVVIFSFLISMVLIIVNQVILGE